MKLPSIISSSILAVGINCCSNFIAQRLDAYTHDKPFAFDRVQFVQFATIAILTTPINFYWQAWLEKAFPGWKMIKQRRDGGDLDEEEKGVFVDGDRGEKEVRVRDWGNIFRKWFADCITIGALFNTALFLILMGLMKGKSSADISADLRNVCRSLPSKTCDADRTGNISNHLRLLQDMANRQLLQHDVLPRGSPNRIPELVWPLLEHLHELGSSSFVTRIYIGPLCHAPTTAFQYFCSSSLIWPACPLRSYLTFCTL